MPYRQTSLARDGWIPGTRPEGCGEVDFVPRAASPQCALLRCVFPTDDKHGVCSRTRQFVTKILTELTSALPFVARMAVKGIPLSLKEPAMRLALSQAIPLSFSAIAMSQDKAAWCR